MSGAYATPRVMLLSEADMCAVFRSGRVASNPSQNVRSEPEAEFGNPPPRYAGQRVPQFLSRRSKNARGVLIGGAALAGAATVGAAALVTAAVAAAWRVRSSR